MRLPTPNDPLMTEAFRQIQAEDEKNVKIDRSTTFPSDVQIGAEFFDRGGAVFNVRHSDFGAVGDGVTDDTAAIQAALDAAETAGGGVVHVPEGDYSLSSALEIDDNCELRGVGRGSRLFRASTFADVLLTNTGRGGTAYSGNSRIIVRDLFLDDRRDDLGSSSNPTGCLAFAHVDGVLIEGVHADQCYYHGVEINACRGFRIIGCHVSNSQGSSIQVDNATGGGFTGVNEDGTGAVHGVIQGNVLEDQDDVTLARNDRAGAIHLHKHPIKHVSIVGNTIRNCANGVTVEHGGAATDNEPHEGISIVGNVMETLLHDSSGTREENGYGIYCTPVHGLTITGNTIQGAGKRGIRLINRLSMVHRHVVVEGNTVHLGDGTNDGEHGIDIFAAEHFAVVNNMVRGSWKSGGSWSGIQALDCTDGTIRGNNLEGDGATYGIRLETDSGTDVERVDVAGNLVSGFATGIIVAASGGATFRAITVESNTVTGATTEGIRLAFAVRSAVLDNIIVGDANGPTAGIRTFGVTDCRYHGNEIQGADPGVTRGIWCNNVNSTPNEDLSFVANHIRDCSQHGIHIEPSLSQTYVNIVVAQNIVNGCPTGIDWDGDVDDSLCIGNRVDGATTALQWSSNVNASRAEANRLDGSTADFSFTANDNVVNGMAEESANAETPTAASWSPGDVVDFTDSGDGSGDGVYLLGLDGSTWTQIG